MSTMNDFWCMKQREPVDKSSIVKLVQDKYYRCPKCGKRVKMCVVNAEWFWPAHKIRKTKR